MSLIGLMALDLGESHSTVNLPWTLYMTCVSSFLSLSLDFLCEKWAYPCSLDQIKAVKTARCSGNEKRDNIRKRDYCLLGSYTNSSYSVCFFFL